MNEHGCSAPFSLPVSIHNDETVDDGKIMYLNIIYLRKE